MNAACLKAWRVAAPVLLLAAGCAVAVPMAQRALSIHLVVGSGRPGSGDAPDGLLARRFERHSGFQAIGHRAPGAAGSDAVAVRDGDVVATVPEPTGLVLALTVLGLALVARPRRGGARRGPDQAAL